LADVCCCGAWRQSHVVDSVGFPRSVRTVLVEQEAEGDDKTALQTVLNADGERQRVRREILQLDSLAQMSGEQAERYGALLDQLATLEADTSNEARALAILKVGFRQSSHASRCHLSQLAQSRRNRPRNSLCRSRKKS
jgi:ATPase subunit of ABC transporter with duplicated ATPase domains